MSDGLTRLSDITARVRGAAGGSDVSPHLATLQDLELVEYLRPVVGTSIRRGTWTVSDPYLRFWFRFVLPNRNRLEHGPDVEPFYSDLVEPALDHFVSKPTFEEICRSWVLDQVKAGTWPAVERVGAWWGPVPARPQISRGDKLKQSWK